MEGSNELRTILLPKPKQRPYRPGLLSPYWITMANCYPKSWLMGYNQYYHNVFTLRKRDLRRGETAWKILQLQLQSWLRSQITQFLCLSLEVTLSIVTISRHIRMLIWLCEISEHNLPIIYTPHSEESTSITVNGLNTIPIDLFWGTRRVPPIPLAI